MNAGGAALVLASASPRRRALLEAAGLSFAVVPSGVEETLAEGIAPEEAALELALRKARAVASRSGPGIWVLGADTVVALEVGASTRLLGKPGSAEEARAMLRSLSGTTHRVVSGVCVVRRPDGLVLSGAETTRVTMRAIEPGQIEAYVASGEWRDKAGGYAIQESAERFVVRLEGGGLDNVVGLPVRLALALLERAGASPESLRPSRRLVAENGPS